MSIDPVILLGVSGTCLVGAILIALFAKSATHQILPTKSNKIRFAIITYIILALIWGYIAFRSISLFWQTLQYLVFMVIFTAIAAYRWQERPGSSSASSPPPANSLPSTAPSTIPATPFIPIRAQKIISSVIFIFAAILILWQPIISLQNPLTKTFALSTTAILIILEVLQIFMPDVIPLAKIYPYRLLGASVGLLVLGFAFMQDGLPATPLFIIAVAVLVLPIIIWYIGQRKTTTSL